MKSPTIKRLALVLTALSMLLSVFTLNSSAASGKIDGISDNGIGLEDTYGIGQNSDYWDLRVRPGDEIRIPLTADMFSWSNDRFTLPNEALKLSEVRGKLKVVTLLQASHEVLDYVQIDYDVFDGKPFFASGDSTKRTGKTAYISVMFAEDIKATEDIQFKLEIRMYVAGKKYDEFNITLMGYMVVDVEEIDKGTDYINLSEGLVVEATEYINNVRVDLGNGLVLYKNMHEGNRYYAMCDIKDGSAVEKEEYPEVYDLVYAVYTLDTINMRHGFSEAEINPPQFSDENRTYFVYNENFELLGTTAERLAYSDVYILTTEELDAFVLDDYEANLHAVPTNERADGTVVEVERAPATFNTTPGVEEDKDSTARIDVSATPAASAGSSTITSGGSIDLSSGNSDAGTTTSSGGIDVSATPAANTGSGTSTSGGIDVSANNRSGVADVSGENTPSINVGK